MHINLNTTLGEVPAYLKEASSDVLLLVFPSVFGLDEDILSLCEAIFSKDVSVLAMDIFWSIQPGPLGHQFEEIEEAFMRMRQLPFEEALSDARVFCQHAKQFSSNLLALGIGYGGRLAFNMLAEERVQAASVWHGAGIGRYIDELQSLNGSLELHYGALDPLTPDIEKDVIAEICKDKPNVRLFNHPQARHGFSLSLGSTFNPECYLSLEASLLNQLKTLLETSK